MFDLIETRLAKDLRVAIIEQQLTVQFQPKVDVVEGRLLGAEILLRWNHPSEGLIPADRWIALAEAHGLIRSLTHWVIDQAVAYLKMPEMKGLTLAINVSPTVLDRALAVYMLEKLKKESIDPARLEIELTESALPSSLKDVACCVKYLRQNGIKVSLDDFGSAYATMKYLVEIPVDAVKIDKEYIQKAPHVPAAKIVFRSLVELAGEIGLDVVCEGVETIEQLRHMVSLGCHVAQGYLTGRPGSFEDFLSTKPFMITAEVRSLPRAS